MCGVDLLADTVTDASAAYSQDFVDGGLAAPPTRQVAVVTCMDARIDPLAALGLELGQAHVLRNAGGVVTEDTLRSLTVSQRALGTREVVVVHHTRCGMLGLSEDAFRADVLADTGMTPTWALGSFPDLEADVRASVQQVRSSPFLLHTEAVSGFVYDVETGRVSQVV